MALHTDLLEQAKHLTRRERLRPRQASLRRAVSAAYYALFHLLIAEATSKLIGVPELRNRFARSFEHGVMKEMSKAFASPNAGQPTGPTGGLPVPPELRLVALTFVNLQEVRHEADYNVARAFTRIEVDNMVARVEDAFSSWEAIRNTDVAQMYLAALLLGKRWSR